MNTELTTAAVERLTAQLGEALFNQPGLDLIEVANRCNAEAALAGGALLGSSAYPIAWTWVGRDHSAHFTADGSIAAEATSRGKVVTPLYGRPVAELKAAKPDAVRLRDELRERTPADYAIEHAGYLVTAANQVIEARNELDALMMRQDEGGDVGDDEMQAAQEAVGDASHVLRLAIHEFEKRRDRALAATGKQQVGEVQGAERALRELIDQYWNLAYAEGKEGRTQDTETGDAQRVSVEIDAAIRALAARQPGGQDVVPYREALIQLHHAYDSGRKGLGYTRQVEALDDAIIAALPAHAVDSGHARAIELLLSVAEAAYTLADNSNDMEDCENIEHADFVALSDALDALDELPDDQPGYTMTEPAKARWALRSLIDGGKAVQS